MKRLILAILMMLALFMLSGCQSAIPVTVNETEFEFMGTLPPPEMIYEPPMGDAELEYYGTATLFLPRKDGRRLISKYTQLAFSASRHEAETAIRALLSYPETENTLSLGHGITLQLTGVTPIEISHDVCTVNLGPSCLALSAEDFYTLCQAITNTATEFMDIKYVNILVAGAQVGLDISSMLPIGTLQRRISEDMTTLFSQIELQKVSFDEDPSQKRFTSAATLYYPAAVGNGILPEVRTIAFEGQLPEQVALTLIEELSLGAQLLSAVPPLPNVAALLSEPPIIDTMQNTGTRLVELHFSQEMNDALADSNITRSAMMASLTYTLTTFVPQVTGVTVFIGDEHVMQVIPSSIYTSGEAIQFANGIQMRSDYARLLLGLAKLYFATEDGTALVMVKRPVPYYEVRNPRYLLGQLILGPQSYDDYQAAEAILPQALGDADLLGFAVYEDALYVHLSQAFQNACQGYTNIKERLLVYAMVNTLCDASGFNRVSFFIAGRQPETLAGSLYLPGEFIQNSGIVHQRMP